MEEGSFHEERGATAMVRREGRQGDGGKKVGEGKRQRQERKESGVRKDIR